MKKILMVLVLALVSVAMVFAAGAAETEGYPTKDINVYIFSSQGGGTDSWCRFLAPLMEADLGVKIISTNMPGANGGTAAQKVWTSPHDGYTVLGASETSMFFGSNGVAPTSENWHFFVAAGSGGIIAVPTASPYQTIQDLVAAAKTSPKSVTIANSGQGKGWHTKAVTLERPPMSSSSTFPTTEAVPRSPRCSAARRTPSAAPPVRSASTFAPVSSVPW